MRYSRRTFCRRYLYSHFGHSGPILDKYFVQHWPPIRGRGAANGRKGSRCRPDTHNGLRRQHPRTIRGVSQCLLVGLAAPGAGGDWYIERLSRPVSAGNSGQRSSADAPRRRRLWERSKIMERSLHRKVKLKPAKTFETFKNHQDRRFSSVPITR